MFYPGKIENWNIIIDCGYQEIKDFPTQVIHQMILHFQINYPLTLNKMFILNPSKSFIAFWRLVSRFISPQCLQKI
jgi:hypothetical protein